MSSSIPTTPAARGNMGAFLSAMDNSPSPVRPNTSARQDSTGGGDEDDWDCAPSSDAPSAFTTSRKRPIGRNETTAVEVYARSKRIRTEQVQECLALMNDSSPVRDAKLMVRLFTIENRQEATVASKAAYVVPKVLSDNFKVYGKALLLSSKLRAYLGSDLWTILLNLCINLGFVSNNVLTDGSAMRTIKASACDTLSQLRGGFKKKLIASYKPDPTTKEKGPDCEHQNIFELTTALVKNSSCVVTVELCARVALWRSTYDEFPGDEFWDEVDKSLETFRKAANGNARRMTKAFAAVLDLDRETHGNNDFDIPEVVPDAVQKGVEDTVAAAVAARASSVVTAADDEPTDESTA